MAEAYGARLREHSRQQGRPEDPIVEELCRGAQLPHRYLAKHSKSPLWPRRFRFWPRCGHRSSNLMLLDASSQEGVWGSCGDPATSAYAVTMPKPFLPKPAKVVPIGEEKRNVIATGETSKRFIL